MQTHLTPRQRRRLFFAAFSLLAIASPLAAQTYRLTDLGTINPDPLTGQRISHTAGINSAGQVAGDSYSGPNIHAARFTNGVVEDLGTIPGGTISTGVGINNLGQVVGDSQYSVNGGSIRHAALWSNGTVTDIGFLPSWGNYARANGINDAGVVVGHSGASLSTTNTHAFIWDATNGMRDLGTLGGPYAQALSINNSNVVTGNARPAGGSTSLAFIWDAANGMRSIGTIGGDASSGAFINANGHVAGTSTINGVDNRQHAFLYDGTTMRDLGSLGPNDFLSDRSTAYGINIHDHVVGGTYRPYTGGALYGIPFLYRDGQMIDLSTRVDASGADYQLGYATGINDAGQIAITQSVKRSTNEIRAVLLTPNEGSFISSGGASIVSAGPNGVLDPGETVTISLGAKNTGSPGVVCTTAGLTGTLQASGGVTAPSGPQNYGTLCSGSAAAFRDFTFTVDPALSCGSTVTVSLAMTDGTTTYGTLTYTFVTGNLATTFVENFDGVAAPARPAGWTTTFSGSGTAVGTSTTFPDTPPNTTFFSEAATTGLSELSSPTIALPSGVSKLTFRNLFNTEATYDGMVLEISINGGAFQDILPAGGSFASGGYNSTIRTSASGTTLAGRMAWSGLSGGSASAPAYLTTVANLPAAAAGQNIQLKWRLGSDNGLAPSTNPGARIDSISIATAVCGGSAPVVSSAVSRKVHGAGGTFDVNLPLVPMAGALGVECRGGAVAGEHQLVVTFAGPVTMSGASVTTGSASMASASVSGSVVTINLAGVTDGQRIGVTLANVSDGVNLGSVMVPLGVLAGDTNGSGAVTGTDVSQTKATASGAMTAKTFRTDVNASGSINATDISIVKSKTGTTLP